MIYLNTESEDQESSVEIMGRYVLEMPDRKGTASVWTSGSSESVSSRMIGGAVAAREGPAALDGPGMAGGNGEDEEVPKASLTWAKIAGI